MKIISFITLISALTVPASASAALRGSTSRATSDASSVDCRLTISTTMEELGVDSDPIADGDNNVVCVPIREDGSETDDVFPVVPPAELVQAHKKLLYSGQLYVKIHGADYVEDEHLNVYTNANFDVYDHENLPGHLRRLREEGERRLTAVGQRTLAIVRITTADNKVTQFSARQLENGLFGNGANNDGITFANQYRKCSAGKLTFRLKEPVIEVKLSMSLARYTVGSMQTEVQKMLKDRRGLASMAQLADNTMFIMPEGMGFTAGAPVNHWRSSYHNRWGLSLAGTMHEIGHNLGLGHAWEDNAAYQDYSGYMAAGSTATNTPQTCFNGYNMRELGWFNDKTEQINLASMSNGQAKLIKVAAYVDYDRAESYEPVLVDINNQQLVLQYNRKSRHNIGTREKGNLLTITEQESTNAGASNMVGGYDVNQQFTRTIGGRKLVVRVCSKVTGNGSNPDALIVSVGNNANACNERWTPPGGSGPTFNLNMAALETAPRATAI